MERQLTPREIANYLHVSYETALDFVKHSGIEYFRIGNQYRVKESVLETYITVHSRMGVNSKNTNVYNKNSAVQKKIKLIRSDK